MARTINTPDGAKVKNGSQKPSRTVFQTGVDISADALQGHLPKGSELIFAVGAGIGKIMSNCDDKRKGKEFYASSPEYQRPEGMQKGSAVVHKVKDDERNWYVSAKFPNGTFTKPAMLSYRETSDYFLGDVNADQLAGKHLSAEFKTGMSQRQSMKHTVSASKGMNV